MEYRYAAAAGRTVAQLGLVLRILAGTFTALDALAAAVGAQTPAPAAVVAPVVAHVGDRVRLTTAGGSTPLVGHLLALPRDSAVVWRDCWVCGPVSLPRQRIIAVERSMGRSHPMHGGVLGFFAGAAVGGGVVALLARHDMRTHSCNDDGPPCGLGWALVGPVAALGTGVVGSIFGVSLSGDVWRSATLSDVP